MPLRSIAFGEFMDQNLWIAISAGVMSLAGGIIARIKRDYFSGEATIVLIAGIFGLILLLVPPKSKARNQNVADIHGWPL
jgi:ABC-type Mn2+/Zn2+ transport system permease subunit